MNVDHDSLAILLLLNRYLYLLFAEDEDIPFDLDKFVLIMILRMNYVCLI
jgi:hypothetical protein